MCFQYVPADHPTVWMSFTPAEDVKEAIACEEITEQTPSVHDQRQPAGENSANEFELEENQCEQIAGADILSVDLESPLTKCRHQRSNDFCSSVSLTSASRLSVAVVDEKNCDEDGAEWFAPIMCGPTLGHLSESGDEPALTTTACYSDRAVGDQSSSPNRFGLLEDCSASIEHLHDVLCRDRGGSPIAP